MSMLKIRTALGARLSKIYLMHAKVVFLEDKIPKLLDFFYRVDVKYATNPKSKIFLKAFRFFSKNFCH